MNPTIASSRQKREQLKRLSWLSEAQAVLGWGAILILVALVGAIYLNQANEIASVGRRVQDLQGTLVKLKRENSELTRKIAEAESLERLESEVRRLGFVPATAEDIEYLVITDVPVTTRMPAALTAEPPPEAVVEMPSTMREAVWQRLLSGIDNLMVGESSE